MSSYIKQYLIALVVLVVLPQSSMAEPLWSDVPVVSILAKSLDTNPHVNSRRVSVDYNQLKSVLSSATSLTDTAALEKTVTQKIDLPLPSGGLQTFNVYESSVMAPELAAKYPQIKTYKVVAENDQTITGRLDTGSNGFHAYLFTSEGEVFIDPVPATDLQQYYSYYKRDYASIVPREFSCGVKSQTETESPVAELKDADFVTAARTSGDMISYRIAVAATGEYSQRVASGSVAGTLSEITAAINRINEIYERDLAIHLELVADNDQIIFTNASTDPYDPTNPSLLIDQNQATLDSVLGSSNYDIGHVFSIEGGGLAFLGVVCVDGFKAKGESGLPDPFNDPFHIDFVAHELGHQLGANHSFNGTTYFCGSGNRNAATAYEPGSGSTIMAYAGICEDENIALASNATFHAGSIAEIIDYTRLGGGNTCPGSVSGSVAPVADAKLDYTIPGGTPFTLTGSATDSETLTYQWDQMDVGSSTTASTHGTDNGSNALFRSFLPVATAERTLPQRLTLFGINDDLLADKAETLPTENRTLNFRLTARDGNGGVDEDDMQVVVDGESGPFEVLQPNTSVIVNSALVQTIQWNAACSDLAPVNCANVDILYSVDDGVNFTSLVSSTPNDGEAEVNFANTVAANARIKIACSDNIFFDISNVDFELANSSGIVLPTTLIGGSFDCGTATVIPSTGDDIEPNNTPLQAQDLTIPSTLNGIVNDAEDPDDYFVFVADRLTYTFTLSNYGSNDLDLYLLDSSGEEIIAQSISETNPTETIVKNLTAGETYYLVVNGWITSAQDSSYTLDVQSKAISSSGGGGVFIYYWLLMLLITPLLRLARKA